MNIKVEDVKRKLPYIAISISGIVMFFILWHVGSLFEPARIPPPIETVKISVELLWLPDPRGYTGLDHLFFSVRRSVIILFIALGISILLGFLIHFYHSFETFLDTWFPFWLTFPTIIIIVVCLVLFDFSEQGVIVAVTLAIIPSGLINIWKGLDDIDHELLQMSDAFGGSRRLAIREIYIPHLMPYIFASFRYMLGAVWKTVLVAEALGLTNGMGAAMRFHYTWGEIQIVISYLLLFIVVIAIIEYGILKPLHRNLFTWRDDPV